MHERRFNRAIERLRDPDRIARLEVERAANLALENLKDARSALDVGTGSGLFAEQFAAHGLLVTGLDANPEMPPAARQYVPTGTFWEGVAEKLPFPDGAFDLVFMGLLLHETDDPLAAVKEAHRVALQRLAVLEWPDEVQSFGPPHADRLSYASITAFAQEAGFKDVQRTAAGEPGALPDGAIKCKPKSSSTLCAPWAASTAISSADSPSTWAAASTVASTIRPLPWRMAMACAGMCSPPCGGSTCRLSATRAGISLPATAGWMA